MRELIYEGYQDGFTVKIFAEPEFESYRSHMEGLAEEQDILEIEQKYFIMQILSYDETLVINVNDDGSLQNGEIPSFELQQIIDKALIVKKALTEAI